MNNVKWDILFILLLTGLLIIHSETNTMESLLKYPFISFYAVYLMGRFSGAISSRYNKR